jgi:hypothetical protein
MGMRLSQDHIMARLDGEKQMTNPADICNLLRTENACHAGFYEHCTKAADLIEAQAAHIAELELERNYLSAQMDQARITIGALEAGYANDLNGDLELLLERIKELESDRNSWRDQCSQRVEDWSKEHERVKALEAKCALLAASLDQEEKHSAALEAQLQERGEPIYQMRRVSGEWVDTTEKAAIENINTGATVRVVYTHPPASMPMGDPIYQTGFIKDQWRDVGRAEFERAKSLRADLARIVYAHPPAAAASEERRDAELWRKWVGYLKRLRRVSFELAKDIDAGIAAQKERQR